MRNILVFCGLLTVAQWMACAAPDEASEIGRLRCEYLAEPLGIDELQPRLSWELGIPGRDVHQSAYRILVASTAEKLKDGQGDLWDSGKRSGDSTLGIRYAGVPLSSRADAYWKVQVWWNGGADSAWSDPAHWSMGLLAPADWKAQWIGLDTFFSWDRPKQMRTRLSARYFRREFSLEKKVSAARVYVSGLGLSELYMNGDKVGDAVLSPGPTDYTKRVFYNTYDVTDKLHKGENAVGVILGNGRFFTLRGEGSPLPPIANYGYPKMRLQLEVSYEDGSMETFISDPSWRVTAQGPILANNEFDGEDYDANKEMPGWAETGFDDKAWRPAELVEAPGGRMAAQMNPLIRVMDTVQPVNVFQASPGHFIFDMGQNMVGWVHVKIPQGTAGDTVVLRFAERLSPDSTLYTANLRSAEATDHYVMKDGEQAWEPRFTYHGFRYVEISGYPGTPALNTLTGKVIYDDLTTTGQFETSNKLLNQIYHNAYWGIRGNYRGMPTDCPQRDERMGWLGDRAVGSYGESFIFDHNTLYAKWLQDIEDAQRGDGSIPDVAPNYWKMYSDNMTWPGAYVIITNMLYHQFGNRKPIEQRYESMKRWLLYMKGKYLREGIMTKDTYGDWCMPPENPQLIHSQDPARQTAGDLLGTAFYYRMVRLLQHFASLTERTADEHMWSALGDSVRTAFNTRFLRPEGDGYSNNTATANIFALAYGLAPDSLRSKVFSHVVDKTMNDFNGHISTGLVGAQWLMRTLSDNGRPDIAYKLATNTTYPSWGYMVNQGATTIWELWNGNTADPAMNSGNHVMLLGDLVVWFYENLAGIRSDESAVGFKKIIMRPTPIGDLTHVNASFHSVRGMIRSEWTLHEGSFEWNISLPANTTAEIAVPAQTEADVTEGGVAAASSDGVRFLRLEAGRALYSIGSGTYHFVSKTNP